MDHHRWAEMHRRGFLRGLGLGAAAFRVPGLLAEQLMLTPRQTEGPFYPDRLPLDTDNDLLIVNNSITPAVGQITHVSGRILSQSGEPVRNAVVEIWQVDGKGVYLHSRSHNHTGRDTNFQGFGRFETASKGAYRFRTVKPAPYPGRTPHIHFAIDKGGKRMLTTQLYIKGEPLNETDGVLRNLRDPKAREAIIVEFVAVHGSKIGELAARFDIVIGTTPEDRNEDRGRRPPRPSA